MPSAEVSANEQSEYTVPVLTMLMSGVFSISRTLTT